MTDVEIRGFLDGQVKFERNVATQYHMRIGCETSKPVQGRYEVMRVLARWDLSALPENATITGARIEFHQEDTSSFPHRYPLRWPVDFYLYEVRKPWNAGRGGRELDNRSPPEPGDAWWLEAKAGELAWQEAGCSFSSDEHPSADRASHPLAHMRLSSPQESLVFSGPRLVGHIEALAPQKKTLDVLIKASKLDEEVPGSIKTFFSREFGDDFTPDRRPCLEVEWQAPALWVEEWPFVLEPEETYALKPSEPLRAVDKVTLCASVRIDASPGGDWVQPEVHAAGWCSEGRRAVSPFSLELPLHGLPGDGFEIRISTATNQVRAGERIFISLLETWAPLVERPEDLIVRFQFISPSGRLLSVTARHVGQYRYVADFLPDEIGIWSYSWKARTDQRFKDQEARGRFTVVRGTGQPYLKALAFFTNAAVRVARRHKGLLSRRQGHFRLTTLQKELHRFLREEENQGASPALLEELQNLLKRISGVLPMLD
jgi:hypothetical protein